MICFFMSFDLSNVEPLLNDFICPRQHIRRNRQADLLGRFEIDDQLKLLWLFHRQIGRLGDLQDFIHEVCCTPPLIATVMPIGDEATGGRPIRLPAHCR